MSQKLIIYDSMLSLLNSLRSKEIIKSPFIFNILLQIDRKDFTQKNPYCDCPQLIEGYNTTISAPHMHAFSLEYLLSGIKENSHILDVGVGSGYFTLALSKAMNETGITIGIDHIEGIVDSAKQNIMKNHAHLIKNNKIQIILGDGRKGYQKYAPYQIIHVGASDNEIPEDLWNQLDYGGLLLMPIGGLNGQEFALVKKDMDGSMLKDVKLNVNYGRLTTPEEQLRPR